MDHFAGGGDAGEHFADAVFAEGAHAQFTGAAAQLGGGQAGIDHLAHFVVDEEQLEDAHTAAVAVAAAFFATDGAEDGGVGDAAGVQREGSHFFFGEIGGSLADGAEFANEALGEHGPHGRGDEERFDADIGETGDGRGSVVGMQGGKHQVAG